MFFCYNDRKFSPQEVSALQRRSPFDFKEADRFLRWEDQQAFILGRLLLARGCKKLGIPDKSLEKISLDRHKRPYLPCEIDFNISHSGKFVLCAVSSSERVGIDVEQIRPVDISEFSEYFSISEYQAITQTADPIAQFFRYWTLKEAAIKADGRGLAIPLSEVVIQGDVVRIENISWYAQALFLDPSHPCHVVSGKPATPFVKELVNLDDFLNNV